MQYSSYQKILNAVVEYYHPASIIKWVLSSEEAPRLVKNDIRALIEHEVQSSKAEA
jgi:hypothetical protein